MNEILSKFRENGIAIWKHDNMHEIEKARNIILQNKLINVGWHSIGDTS